MTPLAIDISDSIIRLAVLERRGRRWLLPTRAEIPVPPGFVVDGDIKQHNEVVQIIRSLVTAAGVKTKDICFALPERHTFVKLISISDDAGKNLAAAVAAVIPQHIPFGLEDVYWDWFRIDQPNSLGHQQVVIGAAPRSTVDEYLRLFTDSGLRVVATEIESVAIARAIFGPQPPDEAQIILDLGRSRSTLILVDHGYVQFSSTLRYAGRELNQYIADELHITLEQAERAKSLFGLDPKRGKGMLRKVLLPHIVALADAVAEVEAYYQEHFVDHRPVGRIFLTGSGALLRGIEDELRQHLNQLVVVQPSWISEQLHKTSPDLPTDLGYTYSTALGLGLQSWFSA